MALYKIRDRATGLFSMGGMAPRWTKNGKTWSRLGDVVLHLYQVRDYQAYQRKRGAIPETWEVVEVITTYGAAYSARELFEDRDEKRQAKREKQMKRYRIRDTMQP